MEHRTRLHLLDALRGALLISMIAYHGIWNLVNLVGMSIPWYDALPGYLWQQSICWTFIALSGFCWKLSRNHLRRGLLIFGGGMIVSAVTLLVMPENRILFGILTCTGSCVLLMIPLEKLLRRIPEEPGAALSFLVFALLRSCSSGTLGFAPFAIATLPRWLYQSLFTAYLGFPPDSFWSTDYFPLLPWLFLFLTGYFLHGCLQKRNLNEKLFAKGNVPVLNTLGRHSLLVYLLHQPVLYGLCMAADFFTK